MTQEHRRSTLASKAWYNWLSPYYDTLIDPFHDRLRRRGIDSLGVSPDDRVLDVGCGTGRGCAALLNTIGSGGQIVGIDVAEKMCHLTRDVLKHDLTSCVVRGDVLALPFDSDSFDAVIVSFTLELFGAKYQPSMLNEIHRVLTTSGRICVIAPSTAGSHLVSPLYNRLHNVFPTLVDSRPLNVSGVLVESGFEIVHTEFDRVLVVPVEIVVGRSR